MKRHESFSALVLALATSRRWLEPAAVYLTALTLPLVLVVLMFGRDPILSLVECVLAGGIGAVVVAALVQAATIRRLELRREMVDLRRSIFSLRYTWVAMAALHLLIVAAFVVLALRR